MPVYGCVYDTTTLAVVGLFSRMTSGELAAIGLQPTHAMLEYAKATYPALDNETMREWCVNSLETLPLLKDVKTLSADKSPFDADGVDISTVSITGLTADVEAEIIMDSTLRFTCAMTVAAPSFGLTADVPTTFVIELTMNSPHYASSITVEAT